MVVDDVEDDGDPECMGAVDEAAEIIGSAVKTGRREKIDAVISPAEPTGEFRHRHDFEAGDTELGESRQFSRSGFPASIRGEGADMHLVDDEVLARPTRATPRRSKRSPRDRRFPKVRAARPVEISTLGRGAPFHPVETKTIAHAGSRRQAPQ